MRSTFEYDILTIYFTVSDLLVRGLALLSSTQGNIMLLSGADVLASFQSHCK